jgi:hypothetical protein
MTALAANSRRDLRFDSLRGLMLVFMTVNHLPSSWRILTDQPVGICTAAEGFVFISGLLAGMVYTRKRRQIGPDALHEATRKRTNMIYLWHVGSLLAALGAVQLTGHLWAFCSRTAPQLFYSHPFWAIALGSTLLYQPGMLDILPLYCALVAILPFALTALETGRRGLLLAASFGLWLFVQGSSPIDGAPLYPIHVGTFNLFAWQFLFILGVVIGHGRISDPRPQITIRWSLIGGASAIAVFGWGIRHLQWRAPWPGWLYGISLNKPSLGFLRLGDFAAVAYLIAVIGSVWPRLLRWRPLAYLGQHSLAVVASQSVVGIVLLQFPWLFATPMRNWLTTAAAVALLFAAAAVHQACRRTPTVTGDPDSATIRTRQPVSLPLSPADDVRAA